MYEEDRAMKKSEMQKKIEKLQVEKEALQKANAERNEQIEQLNMEEWSKLITSLVQLYTRRLNNHESKNSTESNKGKLR